MWTLSQGRTPWRVGADRIPSPHDGKWCEEDALPDCAGCHTRVGPIHDGEGDPQRVLTERLEEGTCPTCGPVKITWTEIEMDGELNAWHGRGQPINGGN